MCSANIIPLEASQQNILFRNKEKDRYYRHPYCKNMQVGVFLVLISEDVKKYEME